MAASPAPDVGQWGDLEGRPVIRDWNKKGAKQNAKS